MFSGAISQKTVIDIIGYTGGSILGIQLIPQIYKAYKTQSSDDISIFFLLMNIVGLTLMTAYGVCNEDMPLYIPTSISLINSFVLLMITRVNFKQKQINLI